MSFRNPCTYFIATHLCRFNDKPTGKRSLTYQKQKAINEKCISVNCSALLINS